MQADYVYGNFTLSNIADNIILQWNGQIIDEVTYQKKAIGSEVGFDVTDGVATGLDPGLLNADLNDAYQSWCPAKKPWLGSKGDLGTPGKANPSCANPCKNADKTSKGDHTACGSDPTLPNGGLMWCISGQCVFKPYCGDGKIDLGEVCDDGNNIPGDGCDPTCKPEPKPLEPGTLVVSEIMADTDAVASAALNARFLRSFGPQARWLSPLKGDILSLTIDEGVGVSLADSSGNAHKAGVTGTAAWLSSASSNASGPYCKVGGVRLAESDVLHDADVIQPALAACVPGKACVKPTEVCALMADGTSKCASYDRGTPGQPNVYKCRRYCESTVHNISRPRLSGNPREGRERQRPVSLARALGLCAHTLLD